jgi:ribosomal protein S18 acetylase RimI-like enzyme
MHDSVKPNGDRKMHVITRFFGEHDREWARGLLAERWGSSRVVSRGILHHADTLPGFVAVVDSDREGLITYQFSEGECEIVTLDSLFERCGIGTALLEAVMELAQSKGCRRLWLITTNDNISAQEFYKNRGFKIVAVHKDAIDQSRKLKPEIPETGIDGVPIRDEIEMEINLTCTQPPGCLV